MAQMQTSARSLRTFAVRCSTGFAMGMLMEFKNGVADHMFVRINYTSNKGKTNIFKVPGGTFAQPFVCQHPTTLIGIDEYGQEASSVKVPENLKWGQFLNAKPPICGKPLWVAWL